MSDDRLSDDRLDGVARDASTILDVLGEFEREGYPGQFGVKPEGTIECLTCRRTNPASAFEVLHLRRLEGASDPDDLLALAALACPSCNTRGTLVVNYGPSASEDDAAVLRHLEPASPDPA